METLRLRPLNLLFIALILWLASSCGTCELLFKCGRHVFGYPFGWRNSGCGDPALQLDCDYEQQTPVINIKGYQYYIWYPVEYYHPSNRLQRNFNDGMILVDGNLGGTKCNPSFSNAAQFLSNSQFHISGNYTNLTLLERCAPETITDWLPLPCNRSWYYSFEYDSGLDSKCESRVVIPLAASAKGEIHPIQDYFTEGVAFDIKWNVSKNCMKCDSNGGRCAYDHRSMEFCYNSKNKIIILGFAGGGFALLAAVALVYIFYGRRRKPRACTRGFGSDSRGHHRSDMETGRPDHMQGSLSIFSYQELEQATNFFDEENEVGDGGYGAVYLGKLQDGRVVAVKRLYKENSRREEQFANEVQILSSLSHPNLVRLYGCTNPQSPIPLLVYEFLSNGTLWDHLHGSRRSLGSLSWRTRLDIAIETAQALAYLHTIDPPIFHRDVKSNNILLDENFRAKVADFGLSRLVPVDVSHVTTAPQGTPGYLDPEYYECFQLTEKSDVYSFGVVLVEIISSKVAVDITRNRSEITLANMAMDKIRRGVLDELVDPDLKIERNEEVKVMVAAVAELAIECLASERDFRPGMNVVVSRLEQVKQLKECKTSNQLVNVEPTAYPNIIQQTSASVPS